MKKENTHTENGTVANSLKSDVARREEEVLTFWKEYNVFEDSVAKESPNGDFVFYDGPPFATGLPHYGHILAGTIKDAIPRFWTMNGYRVKRKWGWDCHGLPLENIIEKKLGLATKRDIEELGVKKFNEAARDAVLEYADDWRRIIPRMGRFVDMDDDYKTMDASYTESVWWVFNELNKKGLVYEGFKSMHLCPRCGTTLSNFEVNQGYKDIKDISVTVKMPLLSENGEVTNTSILIWTTTPWTLPGNTAIAINRDIEYVKAKVAPKLTIQPISGSYVPQEEGFVILAKEILKKQRALPTSEISYEFGDSILTIVETMKGEELIGKSYQPPFEYLQNQDIPNKENAWKIYHADYVELGEEGTGAVHIAPAYGEDDMNLAKEHNVPIVHHVDVSGRFMDFVTDFKGQLVKPKDDDDAGVTHLEADIKVLKRLQEIGKCFAKENITHSYPHCWRCDTPLLNYATTSWFVRVTHIKDKLVEANNGVTWVPEHVGRSRFGKWLEGARDWAISRQRYWGAPLPIWRNEKTKTYKVFGSLADLQEYVPKSGNSYFLTRHGESELNTQWILNGVRDVKNALTEKGKEQVDASIETLRNAKIDLVYYSPLERTSETAHRIADALGLDASACISDDRLMEMQFGEFEGKKVNEYHAFFGSGYNRLIKHPEGGECWNDVRKRVGSFLYEVEATHRGKQILIVSHNGTLQMIQAVAYGTDHERLGEIIDHDNYDMQNAEVREVTFVPMPHNDNYELDFHRPYIDEIDLFDLDGTKLVRVPDVFDCWFESGSMPYAQNHYPFHNLNTFDAGKGIGFPADFIAESIDQTRGWFYSLIVLGVSLFGKSPYKHVITNGLVLAEDGKKMSKKLQNYPDPMELADRVGADAIRYYLLSSPIIKGEDLNFSEKEVLEQQRKNIGRLHNVLAMYEMYADENIGASDASTHVLDRWIVARLNATIAEATNGYKKYELDKATRPLEELIDDISVWYLRRSRERLKSDDVVDKQACLATLRHVLKTLACIMAPVMPFYAEYLFLRVREAHDAISVHLMSWPISGDVESTLIEKMKDARSVVTQGLELRQKAGLKVRQPLQSIEVTADLLPELVSIVQDELNLKKIIVSISANLQSNAGLVANLDTTITSELKREGDVRDLMRAIQELRKTNGLNPHDRISLMVSHDTKDLIVGFEEEIMRVVGALEIGEVHDAGNEIRIDGKEFRFDIVKK